MQPVAPSRSNNSNTTAAKQPQPGRDARFDLVDKALKRIGYRKDALVELLHSAQEAFGYLSSDLLTYVAKQLKLPPSHVYGVATFYHLFSFKPLGDHTCVICMGTPCYVKGAENIITGVNAAFGISPGETTADGKLSVNTTRCLGSCGLAPLVVIDGVVSGKEPPEAVVKRLQALLESKEVKE